MLRLRFAAVVICLMTLAACSMWKNQKGWSGATSGEQFERLWWEDVKNKRLSNLEQRLSNTFLGVTPEAVLDRAGYIENLQRLTISDYSLGDFVTQTNGADVTVTYRATLNGTLAGQPVTPHLRYLSVWQQVRHGWILTAQSVTPDTSR